MKPHADIFRKPVNTFTIKAKITLWFIQLFYRVYAICNGRKLPLSFEENPLTMRLPEALYLGYKYYYHSPTPGPEMKRIFNDLPSTLNTSETMTDVFRLTACGDLMPYMDINSSQCSELWNEIENDVFGSEIVFANLETPFLKGSNPNPVPEMMLNHMNFNASLEQMHVFIGKDRKHKKGQLVLSLCNNHSFDQGREGIASTCQFLQKQGIGCVGVSSETSSNGNFHQHQDTYISEVNGIKIGWMAFTYCINHHQLPPGEKNMVNILPLNKPLRETDVTLIQEKSEWLKSNGAEILIGSFHMGNAYQPLPNKEIFDNIQLIIDRSDLDVFIGTHPHIPQPVKMLKNKKGKVVPVAFSLGDFVGNDIYTFSHLSLLLHVDIGRDAYGIAKIAGAFAQPVYLLQNKNKKFHFKKFDLTTEHIRSLSSQAYHPEEPWKLMHYTKEFLS
jgi:hypothetical protein